jgi:ATP-dependent DNA helicase RecG
MAEQDLLAELGHVAEEMLAAAPEQAKALVDRWFGHKIDFGQV